MRWEGRRESGNVEDQRGGGGRVIRYGAGGLGGLLLVILILFLGGDPRRLLETGSGEAQVGDDRFGAPMDPSGSGEPMGQNPPAQESAGEAQTRRMISVVLADTEDIWSEIFRAMGRTYEEPKLVLFTDAVESGCGFASAAVGPFYCPRNGKVYLDLRFYDELHDRFGASGDFAQAYVLAHEIGHHVQNLLGISDKVAAAQARGGGQQASALSVRLELQADCLAGVWAHHADRAHQLLEQGDVEEGLRAASAIGDDRIQMQSQGYVAPDAFTHGSSEERVSWFRRGIEQGSLDACNTFE
jgi:predicted metalloprotease